MLVTDDATARKLRLQSEHPFDIVAVDAGASHAAEFEATRPVADRSSLSTAERWRNRRDPANLALRRLRAAKIRAVATALQHFDVALLMDADTYVCSSLLEAACAVSEGPVVAFVPVDRGREHAASVLARSERWRVPGHAVEANTGVVAWRNAPQGSKPPRMSTNHRVKANAGRDWRHNYDMYVQVDISSCYLNITVDTILGIIPPWESVPGVMERWSGLGGGSISASAAGSGSSAGVGSSQDESGASSSGSRARSRSSIEMRL